MVDLRAAGHSRREAAAIVAGELYKPGGVGKAAIAERLRKHFRELESSRQLPKSATPIERQAEAIVASYQEQTATVEQARLDLEIAEEKARSLGLDLEKGVQNLLDMLNEMRKALKTFLDEEPRAQAVILRRRGIEDPQEAARRLLEMDAERQRMEDQVNALLEVRRLRSQALYP